MASAAGASILERGGSAVDETRKLYGLNARGWAPEKVSIAALKPKGISGKIPVKGDLLRHGAGRRSGVGALYTNASVS